MTDPSFWPWFVGGAVLAAVPILNWAIVRRTLAVSGRFTGLVDRIRLGPTEDTDMTEADMVAALQAMTEEAFGPDAIDSDLADPTAASDAKPRPRQDSYTHVLFLLALVVGGFLATLMTGDPAITMGLDSKLFAKTFGEDPAIQALVLAGGGVLVGFGTRMSGGCTSGHGLCGLSRFQPGSALSTASFFGAGIATSFILQVMW